MSQIPHRDDLRAGSIPRLPQDHTPGNSSAPRPRAVSPARQEFEALTAEFAAWFAPRERRLGAGCWSAMRADARRLTGTVADMERLGLDLADKALLALLPYDDHPELRGSGAFCHVLPGLTRDPRAWFADAGWTAPEDWPALARGLFLFVRRCDENPGELWQACHELGALPGSRGFDSALLSPVLNALRPDDFLVVNAATRATLNHFTGSAFGPALSEYPEAQVATRRLIENSRDLLLARAPSGMRLGDCFAVFSHWLMNERLPAGLSAERAPAHPQAAASATSESTAPTTPAAPQAGGMSTIARALAHDDAVVAAIAARSARAARALRVPAPSTPEVADVDAARPEEPAASAPIEAAAAAPAPAVAPAPAAQQPAAEPMADDEPAALAGQAEVIDVVEVVEARAPEAAVMPPAGSAPADVPEPDAPAAASASADAPIKTSVAADALAVAHALPESLAPSEPQATAMRRSAGQPVRGHDASPEAAIALAQAPHAPERAHAAAREPAVQADPARAALEQLVGLAGARGQLLLCGRPGAGTARWAEAVANELRHGDGLAERLVFHPGWTRADFLQSVDAHGNRRAGRFTEFCRRAAERNGRSVLIIHALQRADADAVFAEALELLDLRDVECSLAGSGSLAVPGCLAIVAGCETSDGLPPDAPAITQHFACAGVPGVLPPGSSAGSTGQ